ncbi:ABC transporter ATP-binding protein [Liquorilactobacillus nagelii]|jgi:ABC-2 type transport system ATP-binding protein|uniref:ABC transporter ATP-binding protein n=1 Tax=Liquorilactobacillus nagelii TaxID=82688 RepID=UPI0039EBCD4C
MENVIQIKNLYKKIKKKVILQNINLTINKNKIYGFSGPNGSGKTMTFKVILGFVRPTSGKIVVNNEEIRKDTLFAQDVGFSITEYGPLIHKTAQENLELLALLGKHNSEKIPQLLSYVGLKPDDKRKVKEFSLGMKQRLSIAMALIGDADILIFDEPTNALDEEGQQFLLSMLKDQKKLGKTILISSHDKNFLTEIADKIFVYSNGSIIREEEISEK